VRALVGAYGALRLGTEDAVHEDRGERRAQLGLDRRDRRALRAEGHERRSRRGVTEGGVTRRGRLGTGTGHGGGESGGGGRAEHGGAQRD
jgi:hypothetical protein